MKRLLVATVLLLIQSLCQADLAALNCRTCHRQANTEQAVPDIGQLSAEQISRKLLDFKYDRLPATLMSRIAKGYSDEELLAVAKYLGKP